jgi:hypothetical protein
MVIFSAFICTALAIFSPFPLRRTIDEVVAELEGMKPYQSVPSPAAPHCTLYTNKEGKRGVGPEHPVQVREIVAQRGIRFAKKTVLAVVNWICLVMTIVSTCFLIYDVVVHGFLFRASLLPLALTIAFPILSSHAERSL